MNPVCRAPLSTRWSRFIRRAKRGVSCREWWTPIVVSALLIPIAAAVNGCGGGGGGGGSSSGSTPTPAPSATPVPSNAEATLSIIWPGRYRSVTAPTGAESVAIVITRADTGAVVTQRTIARPTSPTGSTSVDSFTGLPQTTLNVGILAYPVSDGSGTLMASGGAQLAFSGTTTTLDLSLSLTSTIDHLIAALSAPHVGVSAAGTLMVTAYDSSGNVVLLRSETFSVTSSSASIASILSDPLPMPFVTYTGGTTTFTVTDSESGKSASALLTVGYPYSVAVTAGGTRGSIPFMVDTPDDALEIERLSGDTFSYTNFSTPYSNVASQGSSVMLQAPPTYGDRQFSSWTFNGSAGPTTNPVALNPVTQTPTQAVANYTQRQPAADGSYSPNYFGEIDNSSGLLNYPVQWDRSSPVKVSFVTTDGYTDAREQLAEQGFQYWTTATNGVVQFTILPNDDPTDADVIVAFTTPDAPNPSPSVYIPNATYTLPLTSNPQLLGQTFWQADPATNIGYTKRVVLIYYNRFDQDIQLRSVAAHEMGHALGSGGHSNDPNNMMYYTSALKSYVVNGSQVTTLTNQYPWEEDMNMMATLYQQGGYDLTTRSVRKRLVVPAKHGPLRSYAMP